MNAPQNQPGLIDRLALFLYSLVRGRDKALVCLTLVVLIAAGWGASKLYISQDFRRMLPQDSASIQQLLHIDAQIGNQSDLYVVIKGNQREQNIAFGERLEERLRTLEDLRSVIFKRELQYLEDRALLYLSLSELLEIHDDVKETIKKEVAKQLSIESETESDESEASGSQSVLDKNGLRDRLEQYDRPQPYSETDDGRVMVLTARPRFQNTDAESSQALCQKVEDTIALIKADFPEIETELQGSFAEQSKRQKELDASVVQGSILAFFILLASIGLYFRSIRVVFWILIPLAISITAALAFAQVLYGYLNLVSAFIVAILLGIGIDFGIHVASRYAAERRDGHEVDVAIKTALETTGISTFAGALSTALSLLLLIFAEFQGLAQFGVVAALGVLLAFLGAVWVLPLLLRRLGEGKGLLKGARTEVESGGDASPWPFGVSVGIAVLGVGLLVWSVSLAPKLGFEYDLRNLDGRKAPTKTSTNAKEKKVSWRDALPSGATTAVMVATTDSGEQTREIHRQLEGYLRKPYEAPVKASPETDVDAGEDEDDPFASGRRDKLAKIRSLAEVVDSRTEYPAMAEYYEPARREVMRDRIRRVFSLYTFIPEYQKEKLKVIGAIRKELRRKKGQVSEEARAKIEEFEPYLKVRKPIIAEDLPTWVKEQLSDVEGNIDRFVLVWAGGAKADLVNSRNIRDAFGVLETPDGQVTTGATYFIMPAVLDALHRDGPLLLMMAFTVMLITCLALFKSLRPALTVVGVVGVAMVWLVGLMVSQGWKVDLFNLVSIPLIIGMGQDHSIHMVHRLREEGVGALKRIVRETGGAIFLTTWTTAIGFVGALFAPQEGLRSLARVSLSGMVLCFVASVLFFPALADLKKRLSKLL